MHEDIKKDIDDLEASIAELKQRAASLTGKEREECYKEIAKVEDQKNKLHDNLHDAKEMGKESWDTVKDTISQGVSDIRDGFKNIYSRFKM